MTRPITSEATESIYESLGPWQRRDTALGNTVDRWDLLHLCESMGQSLQKLDDVIRDRGETPGWAVVMDPDEAPAEWLPWLGQFVGVRLPEGEGDAESRVRIKTTPNFHRGGPDAMRNDVGATLSGDKQVYLVEKVGDAYHFTVAVRQTEAPETDWDPRRWRTRANTRLQHLWGFDETSGTALDEKGGWNGTLQGLATRIPALIGLGNALRLDGVGTSALSIASVAVGSTQFSLRMYAKVTVPGAGAGYIFDALTGVTSGWSLRVNTLGQLIVRSANGASTNDTTGTLAALTTGTLAAITITYDGTTVKIYINNTLAGSAAVTIVPPVTTTWRMGRQIGGANPIAVDLDDVAYFNQALSLAAITDLNDTTPTTAIARDAAVGQKPGGLIMEFLVVGGMTYALLAATEATYAAIPSDYATYADIPLGSI